jgi:hypothetical protein
MCIPLYAGIFLDISPLVSLQAPEALSQRDAPIRNAFLMSSVPNFVDRRIPPRARQPAYLAVSRQRLHPSSCSP